jgi:hypothetical protein
MSRILQRGPRKINYRHPDARGLVLAVPLNEGGGATGTSFHGLNHKLLSGTATGRTGTDWRKCAVGIQAYFNTVTTDRIVYTNEDLGPDNLLSVSLLVTPIAVNATNVMEFFESSSSLIGLNTDGKFCIGATAAAVTSYGDVAILGKTYQVGFSVIGSASGFVYIDGVQIALSANFPTVGSGTFQIGCAVGTGTTINFALSDIRVWNRLMPPATFRRHYLEGPSGLYARGHAPWRFTGARAAFNAGGFLPFMHPSFQS